MKLRQKLKKQKKIEKAERMKKRLVLLDDALKKLVDLNIAMIDKGRYKHSHLFEQTVLDIRENPPSRFRQMKYGQEAGRKLIPQILAMALSKPSRRDIDNMITGYVCLKIHMDKQNLQINNKIIPDLAYAIWYLNDHEPTLEEVEEWKLTSQK